MNPNTDKDPLDQRIDALLSSRPIKASDDFTARVMAATEGDTERRSYMRKVIPFALPIAAAIAVALVWMPMHNASTPAEDATAITTADAQEIFLLEEGLSGLADMSSHEFGAGDLLSTLDALYLEI